MKNKLFTIDSMGSREIEDSLMRSNIGLLQKKNNFTREPETNILQI